jgi:signal transduction histidine kinase
MVLNLIDNAIKSTQPGGSVDVSTRVNDGNVEIEVADTGIGIQADLAAIVFNRFYKGDRTHNRARPGSGLGLSIAKWAAEAHGGSISLQSTPGEGSTFTISLPYSRPN